MQKHLLAIAGILTAATGCDNVAWGGIDFELKPPPVSATGAEAEEGAGPVNLAGPVLLAGVRIGTRADFVVVGKVHPGALRAFPDPSFPEDIERLEQITTPGSEWILFSEGVRVGRMLADQTRPSSDFCGSRLGISGVVELVPTAVAADRFLALPAEEAHDLQYDEYTAIPHVYDQRVAINAMASTAIREYGATRPPSVVGARGHIRAFQLPEVQGQTVAATFLYEDQLAIVSPGRGAYSLFVIGQQNGATYEGAYRSYRSIDADGKGAPQYFDHLDWDNDGIDEILLDVFGSDRRWFAVLSHQDGSWIRTFQDSCGSGSATVN